MHFYVEHLSNFIECCKCCKTIPKYLAVCASEQYMETATLAYKDPLPTAPIQSARLRIL